MIEAGLLVGLALLVSLAKLNWHWKLRILSNPFLMDCIVFAVLVFIHWGTFTGVMAATVGALMCSLVLEAGRFLFGFYKDGKYVPGKWDMSLKLK